MDTKSIDVKTPAASSAAASEQSSQTVGAKTEQSPSSTNRPNLDVKEGESMEDFIAKSVKETHPTEEVDPEEEGAEEKEKDSETDSKTESDEKEKDGEGEKEDANPEEKEGTGEDKKDVPFEAEPGKPVPYKRFQEVITQKNETARQLEEVKPKVQNYDNIVKFCSENQINADQYAKALNFMAAVNKGDAEAALAVIEPIMTGLKTLKGDVLPSDLQAKVDNEEYSLEAAREIAKLRAKTNFSELSTKQKVERQEQERQRVLHSECAQASDVWVKGKQTLDPGFKPKTSAEATDGKWEFVKDKYLAMLNEKNANGESVNPIRTANDVAALLERAYSQVDRSFGTIGGRPKAKKSLSSNGSSTTASKKKFEKIEDAPTMEEGVQAYLNRRQ